MKKLEALILSIVLIVGILGLYFIMKAPGQAVRTEGLTEQTGDVLISGNKAVPSVSPISVVLTEQKPFGTATVSMTRLRPIFVTIPYHVLGPIVFNIKSDDGFKVSYTASVGDSVIEDSVKSGMPANVNGLWFVPTVKGDKIQIIFVAVPNIAVGPDDIITNVDLNSDGSVNLDDFNILKDNFNKASVKGDVDRDGKVDAVDLILLLSKFGQPVSTVSVDLPKPSGEPQQTILFPFISIKNGYANVKSLNLKVGETFVLKNEDSLNYIIGGELPSGSGIITLPANGELLFVYKNADSYRLIVNPDIKQRSVAPILLQVFVE